MASSKKKKKPAARRPAPEWRKIVAAALDWKQARATLDAATAKLAPDLRGKRPPGSPHSPWELVEHIRLANADLADFMEDPDYEAPEWPRDYWPTSPEPPSDAAWDESLAAIRREVARLKRLTSRTSLDLTKKIPWGSGQTYLRTILVALDHTSYHVGQLVLVRRQLGAWSAG